MYYAFFGLKQPPFRITPDTDFFFEGGNRGAVLEALTYAITHGEGIVKVTGEVGSGKTMLCRVLQARLPESVVSALVRAAATISGSYDRANVLLDVLKSQPLTAATRPLFLDAAQGISSTHDQNRVLAELVRAERR